MNCFAVIAGGGTSGHVLPALAIAESLIDFGRSREEIVYFGARRGREGQLVPPSGLTLYLFDVIGLKRELSIRAQLSNLLFVPKLSFATWKAFHLMRRIRPRVVISVGGYASLPAVLSARLLKIPIVVVTYDRTPGRSSALTSRFATAVASAFPDSPLPRSQFTGAPVRRTLRTLNREEERSLARKRFGIAPECFMIGVVGGSLGSGILNDAILDFVRSHSDDQTLAVRHIVGDRFLDSYRRLLEAQGVDFLEGQAASDQALNQTSPSRGIVYQVVGYEDDMLSLYAAVDVLIGRGGAGTVAEVSVTGTPAILIPWSGAADDHQTENVRWLADAKGALQLSEDSCRQQLSVLLDSLRLDSATLSDLGRHAYALGAKNRAGAIAELVENVARKTVTP